MEGWWLAVAVAAVAVAHRCGSGIALAVAPASEAHRRGVGSPAMIVIGPSHVQIATPLKEEPWRAASLALLLQSMTKGGQDQVVDASGQEIVTGRRGSTLSVGDGPASAPATTRSSAYRPAFRTRHFGSIVTMLRRGHNAPAKPTSQSGDAAQSEDQTTRTRLQAAIAKVSADASSRVPLGSTASTAAPTSALPSPANADVSPRVQLGSVAGVGQHLEVDAIEVVVDGDGSEPVDDGDVGAGAV